VHPAGADALHKMLPNSEVVIMPDIGHLPMVEAPEASATDYLRFRDALDPRPAPVPPPAVDPPGVNPAPALTDTPTAPTEPTKELGGAR